MENKLSSMRILDYSNTEKPVVRMANLCVVSSHTVREKKKKKPACSVLFFKD